MEDLAKETSNNTIVNCHVQMPKFHAKPLILIIKIKKMKFGKRA